MALNYTAEEREVHVWLDDIDRTWRADSSIPKYIRMFQRAGWKQTASEKNENGSEIYAAFEAPVYAISIRKAKRQKRIMTDEQRAEVARRLSDSRNNTNNNEI